MVHSTAFSRSSSVSTASSKMSSGLFPPSSSVVGFRFSTAHSPILLPVATLPVKETLATSLLWLQPTSAKPEPSAGCQGGTLQRFDAEVQTK